MQLMGIQFDFVNSSVTTGGCTILFLPSYISFIGFLSRKLNKKIIILAIIEKYFKKNRHPKVVFLLELVNQVYIFFAYRTLIANFDHF